MNREVRDLGGAVTARVVKDHDSVAWLDLGFESDNGAAPRDFLDVRPLYFDKHAYWAALQRFMPRRGR